MSEDELYREIIIDHTLHPHHRGTLAPPSRTGTATNPVCGDEVTLSWRVEDGSLSIAFTGVGCSISQASASMLCDAVQGKPLEEATALVRSFHASMTGTAPFPGGDLEALQGVRDYPARVKCALLAWNLFAEESETP